MCELPAGRRRLTAIRDLRLDPHWHRQTDRFAQPPLINGLQVVVLLAFAKQIRIQTKAAGATPVRPCGPANYAPRSRTVRTFVRTFLESHAKRRKVASR